MLWSILCGVRKWIDESIAEESNLGLRKKEIEVRSQHNAHFIIDENVRSNQTKHTQIN